MRFVSLVAACAIALTACGAGSNEGVVVAPVSVSDPSGDAGTAPPPQLDLTAAGIAIDGGEVTLSWTVSAPLDSITAEPGALLFWTMVISDSERGRAISVRKSGDSLSASVQFASPKDRDLIDLPAPQFEGDTIRLVVPLKTLKWSGRGGDWVVRTSIRRGEEDSVDVDEIPSQAFKP